MLNVVLIWVYAMMQRDAIPDILRYTILYRTLYRTKSAKKCHILMIFRELQFVKRERKKLTIVVIASFQNLCIVVRPEGFEPPTF